MKQIRHGDILIEQIDELPSAQPTENNLLAQGEGRNHGHFIEGDAVEIYLANEAGTESHFLNIKSDAKIRHLKIDSKNWTGEHHDILIEPGIYRVIRQREFDPYLRTIRIVKD